MAEGMEENENGCQSHARVGQCTLNMYLGKEGSIEPCKFRGFPEAV